MKSLRLMVMGVVFLGLGAFSSSASWADEAQEQANIKNLNDAVTALKQSNPDLAAGLSKFADEEASEVKTKEDEKEPKEKDEAAEKSERGAHIKLLRDAASALKKTSPDLALTLMEMADRTEFKSKEF